MASGLKLDATASCRYGFLWTASCWGESFCSFSHPRVSPPPARVRPGDHQPFLWANLPIAPPRVTEPRPFLCLLRCRPFARSAGKQTDMR
jgi:hypothetical protein